MEKVDFVVIGSGICGLWTALELKTRYPRCEVAVLDREPYPGHHNTTRNSGVLHAGLYYPHGSLKHRTCLLGRSIWVSFAREKTIPHNVCGKYVVARGADDHSALELVFARAQANGVQGLREISSKEHQVLKEYVHLQAGFFSPETGILDVSSALKCLVSVLEGLGVFIVLGCDVVGIEPAKGCMALTTRQGEAFFCENLFNCGGAWAVEIRRQLGLVDVKNEFVKGNYLKLNKTYFNKSLIYPVPPADLKGLGVHTSFHMDGIVRFGPNTEDVQEVDYQNSSRNVEQMYPAISACFKGVEKDNLSCDYTGVRTKIRIGEALYPDFVLNGPQETGLSGYYEMLGIESPGLTAAPALARFIVDKLDTGA